MPKWRDRTCERCGKVEHTASKSQFCILCYAANKRDELVKQEPLYLKSNGYSVVSGPVIDNVGHRCYTVLTPCGHEWSAKFNNLRKQIKNAQSKNLRPACGVCGPKHRFTKALEKYVEKYGVDYDLQQFKDYSKKVRSMTEVTYRNNKHLINPERLKRGHHAHHLDHIIPIIECFKQGWSVERASSISNLQMLTASSNLSKGSS